MPRATTATLDTDKIAKAIKNPRVRKAKSNGDTPAPEAEAPVITENTTDDQTPAEEHSITELRSMTVAEQLLGTIVATKRNGARRPKSDIKGEAGVGRGAPAQVWHSVENQPSLSPEQAGDLAEQLRLLRQARSGYNTIVRNQQGNREAPEALKAKELWETRLASYTALCAKQNVAAGGF